LKLAESTDFSYIIYFNKKIFLEDAELTVNKALGIGSIKAGSATLGLLPSIGTAAVPIFDYGMDIGIKLAEKYCRAVKRTGGEWKFDNILDSFDVPCEDKEKFDKLMRNIVFEAAKKVVKPVGVRLLDQLMERYLPGYADLKDPNYSTDKILDDFHDFYEKIKDSRKQPCYNTTKLNIATFVLDFF